MFVCLSAFVFVGKEAYFGSESKPGFVHLWYEVGLKEGDVVVIASSQFSFQRFNLTRLILIESMLVTHRLIYSQLSLA